MDLEDKRLEEVRKFLKLDFKKSREYKDIVDLASQLCDKPVSMITLLGEDINWIKISCGIDIERAPRETSFCQHTILQDNILVIPDATKDAKFDNNPLVYDAPGVRFYAGAPLVLSNGCRLGSLCLFDFKPNTLNEVQQKTLTVLSRQVTFLMELEMSRLQLLSQIEEINAKNESLQKIAYMQSHEIRRPLASIMGLVSLLEEGIEQSDENWVGMMRKATDDLDKEIHSIVNESVLDKDIRLIGFNKMVEEIEDYAIIMLDKNGNVENWNKGAQKIKGYDAHEIIGQHFSKFYTPEDIKKGLPARIIMEAERLGVCRDEGLRLRKNGTQFWARVVVTAIHNEKGEAVGFTKVTRDISEFKETQDHIDIAEERYRHMIDEIEDYAIILLDADGKIEKWNRGAKKIKGYNEKEIIGEHFSVFYSKLDRSSNFPARFLNEARKKGRARHEGWRVRKDGSNFWGSVVLTAIHDSKGAVIGFVKITKEIKGQAVLDKITA